MVYRPNIDQQRCFVLLPLRSPFLGYFEKIIKPAALEAGLVAVKADDVYGTRAVIRDIWEAIWTARIVIAIVTDKNPNVNYELGMCHTLGIPAILVTKRKEDVPFDYQHRRYLRYKPDEAGWEQKLREDLVKTIKTVLSSPPIDEELPWPYDTFDLGAQRKTGHLIPSQDSLGSVARGVSIVRHVIAPAFGPQGTQVSVTVSTPAGVLPAERRFLLRQGHKIVQGIRSDDPLEKNGIEQMGWLAAEIFRSVGDSTKTGILLAASMVNEGRDGLARGSVPKSLVAGMQAAVDAAATYIMTSAKDVDARQLQSIACTAAASDAGIAKIVVEALKRAGKDGVIDVVDGSGPETVLDVQEGMQFDTGFMSPSFVTDSTRQECVLENCYILPYEGQIASMAALLPIMEQVARSKRSLLVIAGDLVKEALATLILNKEKGIVPAVAVKTPGQGDRRAALLEDIAALTGGRAFLQERMLPLDEASLHDLGQADKVIVTRGSTTIVGGAGKPKEIEARIHDLRALIDMTSSPYDLAKLRERLAKLSGAIAVLRSGGLTDADRMDSRYKLETAMHSCHFAIENGYVVGGGICYYRAKNLVEKLVPTNESEKYGIAAVSRALEEPLRQLIENSSIRNKAELFNTIAGQKDDIGFNAETEKVEDLRGAGVIDAAKVLRESLLLAFSHAKGILTTGAWDAGFAPTTDEEPKIAS